MFKVLWVYWSSILEVTEIMTFKHEDFKVRWLKRQVFSLEESTGVAEMLCKSWIKLLRKRGKEGLHLKFSKHWLFLLLNSLIHGFKIGCKIMYTKNQRVKYWLY